MKTLVVLSGKGGAGKTSVAAGLVPFLPGAVLADADVDASNLPLLLQPERLREESFSGGQLARIDPERCNGCLECLGACRFQGLVPPDNGRSVPRVDPLACEGCGVCRMVCPEEAIEMAEVVTGSWFLSETSFGPMVHARLGPGGENSGALVEKVRREAEKIARLQEKELILVDGPPGTGCPAISALSGADLVLLVTEPTPAGESDLLRVLELVRHFGVAAAVLLNKADLHLEYAADLTARITAERIPVVARFPYDDTVSQAIREGAILSAYTSSWRERFARLWSALASMIDGAMEVTHE